MYTTVQSTTPPGSSEHRTVKVLHKVRYGVRVLHKRVTLNIQAQSLWRERLPGKNSVQYFVPFLSRPVLFWGA